MTTQAIKKLATLGTRHTLANSLRNTYHFDAVVDQLGQDQEVAKLLIAVASEKLRQKAGYRPEKLQFSLARACDKLVGTVICDEEALAYLQNMITHSEWAMALPEWCLYVGMSGQRAPEELVPDLLDYGTKVEVAQEFLMAIIGDRARWLTETLGHTDWQWTLYTPIKDPYKLASQERWKEQYIIGTFYDGSHINILKHSGLTELATLYYSLWSEQLTDAFLYFVRSKIVSRQNWYSSSELRSVLLDGVIRFPLNRGAELLRIFENWNWHHEHIKQLFDFRRAMIKAIYRSKQQK